MKADYTYIIDGKFIFITDLNLGRASVTNAIKSVLEEISLNEGINLNNYYVIYKDSTGRIDGVSVLDGGFGDFYPIGSEDFESAKTKVLK